MKRLGFVSLVMSLALMPVGTAMAKESTAKKASNDAASVMQQKGCKTELEWMKQAGTSHLLHSKGPITVFCPTEAAYGKLSKERKADIVRDPKKLQAMMKYHVAKRKIASSDIQPKGVVFTEVGECLMTNVKDGKPEVDGCLFTEMDIPCSNGVIHLIDEVPLPERGR